ncbi:MAG: FKBP-type peptidyl-prolyl cis-trans isomerase [Bacteroidales bacterium]|nr:FKBP-type peptidyl-prolyl cis-trans isomerase [Bacteroidales bacterium]
MKLIFKLSNFQIFICIIILLSACKEDKKKQLSQKELEKKISSSMTDIHRGVLKNQVDSIKKFVNSNYSNMLESNTGLWYEIYKNKDGLLIQQGDDITLSYTVGLLDGKIIYSSDSLGLLSFRAGSGGVEKGLEEAVLLLNEGDKARLILPPHLAHGLTGDMKKIPRLSILLYDIEVIKVIKNRK